jgi:hypothetical protein
MAAQKDFSTNDVITRGAKQVSTVVNGETLLMSVDRGKYYKLDDIGSRVWALIDTPTPFGRLCQRLADEFGVDDARCAADLNGLLSGLHENGLIQVVAAGISR